jgi:zeta-carotene desaturase
LSAVPFDRLEKLCPPALVEADTRLQNLTRFEVSPILGIHLWFRTVDNQPVMRMPHLVLTHSPLQWLFNKGMEQSQASISIRTRSDITARITADGPRVKNQSPCASLQHLHGVISAAHDMVDWPADRITALVVAEVTKLMPKASDAQLVHARVIKEKRATFSAAPSSNALRPAAHGRIANLYLAGDWCRSGWPATMEGAVRSGYQAAAAVLSDAHQRSDALVPDLAPGLVFRLLCGRRSCRVTPEDGASNAGQNIISI